MIRKPVLAMVAALPLLGAAPPAPTIATRTCPGIEGARATALMRSLFTRLPETRAALLLVDGCPMLRGYGAGYGERNRFISWSMAKTVTAMLVGQLVADGRLRLDAPAPVAEWRRSGDPRGAITLRHLLTMSSGLRHIETSDSPERSDTNQVLVVSGTGNMAARAIAAPLAHRPGTEFQYSSLTTIILAEIVARTLTPSRDAHERARIYRDFAQQRLFGPAGVSTAFLEFDGAGTSIGGSLMHFGLDDFGRLGRLLIDGRSAAGRQVLPPGWVTLMKTPSAANVGYGFQTWLNHPVGPGQRAGLFPGHGPIGTAGMRGHLGQFVAAARGTGRDGRMHDVVVVRLGHTDQRKLGPVIARVGDVVEAIVPAAGSGSARR